MSEKGYEYTDDMEAAYQRGLDRFGECCPTCRGMFIPIEDNASCDGCTARTCDETCLIEAIDRKRFLCRRCVLVPVNQVNDALRREREFADALWTMMLAAWGC